MAMWTNAEILSVYLNILHRVDKRSVIQYQVSLHTQLQNNIVWSIAIC